MSKIPEGICQCGCGKRTSLVLEAKGEYKKGDYRRYCNTHYQRTRGGNPVKRFWSHVDIRSKDECWPWRNAKTYGTFRLNGKSHKASRVAYIFTYGELPREIEVCHTCDNPPCCNYNHLIAGTHKDNMGDMAAKGRANKKRRGKGNTRIKESDVLEIRKLRLNGWSFQKIGDKFSITKQNVSYICKYQIWKHVP